MDITICNKADLQNNQSVKFTIPCEKFDREGFVINRNGEYFAYYNECPHIGIALDWDDNDFFLQDFSKLVCKNHGAEFVPESGSCTTGPCQGTALKTIELKFQNDQIIAQVA